MLILGFICWLSAGYAQNQAADRAPQKAQVSEEELKIQLETGYAAEQLLLFEEAGLSMDQIHDKDAILKAEELIQTYEVATYKNGKDPSDPVSVYTFGQNTGTYVPITGGTVLGTTTSDDQYFVDPTNPTGGTVKTGPGFPIGFNFDFNGYTFDVFGINNNGWMALGQSSLTPSLDMNSTSGYTPLSSTAVNTPDYLRSRVAGMARDLQAQTGAELRFETIGTSPNQVLVIQFTNYKRYGTTGTGDILNFQIRLYETTNEIELVYGSITITNATSSTVQVGLGGSVSTDFFNRETTTDWSATAAGTINTASCTLSQSVYPSDGLTFIFTPPPAGSPGSPYNPFPANGALSVPVSTTLTWTFGSLTDTYDLYLDVVNPPVTMVVNNGTAGTSGEYIPPDDLAFSTTYYWQVVAHNASNLTTNGPVWSFATACGVVVPPFFEDLTTYTGAAPPPLCWDEADNGDPLTGPTGFGTSLWVQDIFGNVTGASTCAKVNMYSTSKREWLITPHFDLSGDTYEARFDICVTNWNGTNPISMGSDDQMMFLISPDGGTTWDTLGLWDASTPVSNVGETVIISLAGYNQSDVVFAFWANEGTIDDPEDYDFFVDNIKVQVPPTCPEPSGLSTSNITATSARLSWIENGEAQEWNIEYGPAGFTLGTGTLINYVCTTPPCDYFYDLTGLDPSTSYSWYVQAVCGGSAGNSAWAGPNSFNTQCATFTAPFVEHFQNTTIPLCWEMSGPQPWLFTTTWPGYGATGLTDHTGTGGSFAGVDGSGTVSLTGITLQTPLVDVSSLLVPQLRFYLFNNNINNTDWLSLRVDLWNGNEWINSIYYWGPTDNSPDWVEVMVVLSAYNITGDIQFRFVVDKSAGSPFYDDLIIDDVYVEEAPTCPAPAALGAANIAQNTADLTWTSFSGLSDIEFGLAGFTPTGIPTYAGVTSPYSVSGLNGVTSYSFYVRDDCGGGDYSLWTGPYTFQTLPGGQTFPIYEDFENGFVYFDNALGNNVNWAINTTYFHSGVQCAHNPYGNSNSNILIETGILDLSSASIVFLEFWQIAKTEGDWDHCVVEISTDGGLTYTPLPLETYMGSGVYNVPLYNAPYDICFDEDAYALWGTGAQIPENTWWQHEIFDITNYLTSSVRVRFRLDSDGSITRYGWLIDDISIYQPAYGTLSGTVTELSTGNPIQGATVSAAGPNNTYTATTQADGTYTIDPCLTGVYNVVCSANAYNTLSVAGVTVLENTVTTQDFALTAPEVFLNPTSISVEIDPNGTLDEILTIDNIGNGPVDWSANIVVISDQAKDAWDLQFTFDVTAASGAAGNAGAECDGQYYYSTRWASNLIHKYDLNGVLVEEFSIPGVTGLRDLAYDGTYFYGGAAANTVYKMDFVNKTLVTSFSSPQPVRNIAYDHTVDGLWVGNWATDIALISMSGTTITTLPATVHNLAGMYGTAFENVSDGTPYLYIFDQGAGAGTPQYIHQANVSTMTMTGFLHNVLDELGPDASAIAGGLFAVENVYPGTFSIGGLKQGVPDAIFMYELTTLQNWLTISPTSGNLLAGEDQDITVHFDATDLLPGVYEAEIHFSFIPDVGSPIVPVTMTVEGLIPPVNLTLGYNCTDVLLTWQMPTGGNPDSWNVYKNGSLLTNVTAMEYTDEMVVPGVQNSYYVTAVYAGVESLPTATQTITVPTPGNLQPLGLQATDMGEGVVELTWNAPNACLAPDGYNITRDGEQINTSLVTELSYQDVVTESGLYQYIITAVYYFGESGGSTPAYVLVVIDGMDELQAGTIQIYPNPASDFIEIKAPVEVSAVTIYSASGEAVLRAEPNASTCRLDISGLNKGIYLLHLQTPSGDVVRKVSIR